MENKCIHDGHRKRLMDTIYNVGLDHLSNVQVTEAFLFYIFPRGDVNPLAHKLLERYSNIADVIDADANELKSIKGIGDRAAIAIHNFNEFFNKVNEYRAQRNVTVLKTLGAISDYFEEMMRFMTTENLYIVGIDHQFNVCGKKKLTSGSVKNVGITPLTIANFVSSSKPAGIILAHNHPNGYCTPSQADIDATNKLIPLIENLGVNFIEHVIVGTDGVYGIKHMEKLRVF